MGDYFVVFGGDDYFTFLNDLWVVPLAPVFPGDRSEGNLSLVEDLSKPTVADDDADDIDDDSTSSPVLWSQVELNPISPLPHNRRGHTLVGMPASNAMLLVGGRRKHEVCLHDTWVLPMPAGWPKLSGLKGSAGGLGWGEVSWQKVDPIPSECRWGHSAALATDPTTKAEIVAVFGGRKEVCCYSSRSKMS
jgi:hypothetical protein